MNKILGYIGGVIAFCMSGVCYAFDRFEVLPDLPDPIAQSANAATVSTINTVGTQTVGHEPSIVSVFFSLVFVILLIYATGIIYTKLNKMGFETMKNQRGDLAKSQVAVVSTTQLGNNKTLHVVELDGKRMLIGASAGAIQLIKDLGSVDKTEKEEYSHIEIPNIKIPKIEIPKIEIPSIDFSKVVTKIHKKTEEKAQVEEKEKEEEETSPVVLEETSEKIIDSLFENGNVNEETCHKNEHKVDPDEYALYKKYLN